MGRAEFTAVRGGHHVIVELGQYNEWPAGRHKTAFEVETHLCGRGSAVLTQNKLYVSELDDDDDDDSEAMGGLGVSPVWL